MNRKCRIRYLKKQYLFRGPLGSDPDFWFFLRASVMRGTPRLTVGLTVEYPPQYGNHPGGVGFGVASGHERSCQTSTSKPFLPDSRGSSGTPEKPAHAGDRGSRPAGLSEASGRCRQRCGVGAGGVVATAIGRGEVRLYQFPRPDKQRPVVVLTRDSAIGYLSAVTVAPITSTVRGVPSEVLLST